MNKTKSLIKNTVIIAIGKLGTQVVSFLLLPVYTGILTTQEYGEYDFLLTLSLFLIPFITLLMEESMFRFLIDAKNDNEIKEIISVTFFFTISATIISCFIIFLLNSILFHYKYIFYLIAFIISSIFLGLANALSRGMSNIKLYSFTNFLSSLLIIIFNILFIVYFKFGLYGMLTSYILSYIFCSIFSLFKSGVFNLVDIKYFNNDLLKKMMRYSLPLVPNSISWVIVNLSSRLVITGALGSAANGIYSVANKFPNLMNTLYGFFYTAWKEAASKSINDTDSEIFYNFIYDALKRVLITITLGLIAIMPFIFKILIDQNYSSAYVYIPILTISMYFSNISGFYGGIFAAKKETKIMGTTTIFGAIINVVVNILLIKYIGIYSATISSLASNLVMNQMRYSKVRVYANLKESKLFYVISIIIGVIIMYTYYINNVILQLVSLIIVSIYALIINRNIIFMAYKTVKK